MSEISRRDLFRLSGGALLARALPLDRVPDLSYPVLLGSCDFTVFSLLGDANWTTIRAYWQNTRWPKPVLIHSVSCNGVNVPEFEMIGHPGADEIKLTVPSSLCGPTTTPFNVGVTGVPRIRATLRSAGCFDE